MASMDSDRSASLLQEENQGTAWKVHLGPFTFRSTEGVFELRPQLKFGGQYGHVKAEAGISDVRDGLRFDWNCKAFAEVEGLGHSLDEVHSDIKQRFHSNVAKAKSDASSRVNGIVQKLGLRNATSAQQTDEPRPSQGRWQGFEEALGTAQEFLGVGSSAAGSKLSQIATSLGMDPTDLERALNGSAAGARLETGPAMTLCVRAFSGFGFTAQMCLGWLDTKGYRMVGVGGTAAALIAAGGCVFAGRHSSGIGIKIVLGIGNFTFQYHFPQAVVGKAASRLTGNAREVASNGSCSQAQVAEGAKEELQAGAAVDTNATEASDQGVDSASKGSEEDVNRLH
jgi:hypothetical protein